MKTCLTCGIEIEADTANLMTANWCDICIARPPATDAGFVVKDGSATLGVYSKAVHAIDIRIEWTEEQQAQLTALEKARSIAEDKIESALLAAVHDMQKLGSDSKLQVQYLVEHAAELAKVLEIAAILDRN